MNLVAQAVEVPEPPLIGVDINEQWTVEDTLRRELPSEKRLMVDDIYKVLYFNNADPELVSASSM